MHRILIAIGSNRQQAAHIQWASQRLACLLHDIQLSPTLWTEDAHSKGFFYMNRLAMGFTSLSPELLEQELKALEAETGRTSRADSKAPSGSTSGNADNSTLPKVTLDLDLMLYDDQHYHPKDWPQPYIQQLISHFML